MSSFEAVDPNLLSQTKKVRRVKILNVPLYLGIHQNDIKYLIDQYLTTHYLKNPGNKNPILCVDMNHTNNSVIVEFSSVEEANRVIKLEVMELIGVPCKVQRCSESMYGNQQNMVDKLKKIKVNNTLINLFTHIIKFMCLYILFFIIVIIIFNFFRMKLWQLVLLPMP